MTNNFFFSIKYKMLPAYGFHINFGSKRLDLVGPRWPRPPRGTKSGSACSRVYQSEIFHFQTVFYEYWQLWKVVDLKYQQFWAKNKEKKLSQATGFLCRLCIFAYHCIQTCKSKVTMGGLCNAHKKEGRIVWATLISAVLPQKWVLQVNSSA